MPAGAGGADAATTSVTQRLDALFAPWNRTDEPGLTVGVAHDGAVIYRRGFGMASLESPLANTPTTRMRIGSISKHFAALLALLLAEEGKLDLEAPIRTYIPELTGPAGDPTLRLLMQHRGGGRCAGDLGFIGHGMSRPPVGYGLRTQQRQEGRNFAPGTAMIYNNSGYSLLCIAIERVGGASFGEQVKQRLAGPLGMPDTFLAPSDYAITPGLATLHIPSRGGWRRGLLPTDEGTGDGAIVSTVDDMLRWMAHLRTRDRFGSAASWAALTERPRYADGSLGVYSLGLTWSAYCGRPILFHGGAVMGGTAMMMTFPDDGLDVVVLANGGRDADVVGLSLKVADIVLDGRLGPPAPTVPAEAFAGVLGDYWSPENGMIYSLLDQGGLLACSIAMAAGGVPLQPADDGWLVFPAGSVGEIRMRPAPGAALEVTFGGETHLHERLAPSEGDAAAFDAAALGRYASHDAGASAAIEAGDEGPMLVVSDGYGEVRHRLTALSPRVAYGRARGEMAIFRPTITLDAADGLATGFSLNTARTRGLAFERV